jgi:hypothetical protein
MIEFTEDEVVSGQMPMLEALELVRARRRIFVSVLGEVNGIVTQSDVTKPPVRLWLFGLLMIFEMQVSRLVRARYPDGSWIPLLSTNVVKAAEKTRASLLQQGNEMDLADCLTLSAKQQIVAASPDILAMLDLAADEAPSLFNRVRQLRNSLAHVHEISHQWPDFLQVARDVERVVQNAENISRRAFRGMEAGVPA